MKQSLFAVILLCAISACAQINLEIVNPPTSTQTGYSDIFNTLLAKTNGGGGNVVNGITVFLDWGNVDNGCETSVCAGQAPASVPTSEQIGTCLEADCYWAAIDPELLDYIDGPSSNGLASHGQKINLIVVAVPEGQSTSNGIPWYVFQPSLYTHTWCSGCSTSQPQDLSTCTFWSGDSSAPTGGGDGLWNVNTCRMTGGGTCPGSTLSDVTGGYPVLYEAPFMSAYRIFVQRLLKHYSSMGSGSGPTIGQYLGYIRIGLAEGGENQPLCTTGTVSGTNYGIWPSPQGLSYDLVNSIDPDWFATTTATPPCSPTSACQGKDAYLEGINYAPGYVKTMWSEMQSDLASWDPDYSPNWINLVANTHTGPPGNSDISYANIEASIFGSYGPVSSNGVSGFGMESLSEWDVANAPSDCTENWCANFTTYSSSGTNPDKLNLYLQTTTPNSEPVYTVSSITHSSGSTSTVTCSSTCATTGATGGLLKTTQWVKITGNSGASGVFTISSVSSSTQFVVTSCSGTGDSCTAGTFSGGTIYTGDYLPDTIPTAVAYYADTLEVFFCDWEFAFVASPISSCPAHNATYSADYASILTTP
jgi:hypothetical protein